PVIASSPAVPTSTVKVPSTKSDCCTSCVWSPNELPVSSATRSLESSAKLTLVSTITSVFASAPLPTRVHQTCSKLVPRSLPGSAAPDVYVKSSASLPRNTYGAAKGTASQILSPSPWLKSVTWSAAPKYEPVESITNRSTPVPPVSVST